MFERLREDGDLGYGGRAVTARIVPSCAGETDVVSSEHLHLQEAPGWHCRTWAACGPLPAPLASLDAETPEAGL